MKKLTKILFNPGANFNTTEFKKEFEDIRMEINIQRCKKSGTAILILNVILIMVDLFVYKSMRAENQAYLYLYYSHIIATILIALWITLVMMNVNYGYAAKKILFHLFTNIILYWCVFVGINNLEVSGQISAYLTSVMALSAVLYFSRIEAYVTLCTSLVIFIIGLCLTIDNTKMLYSYIINSVIAVFFSLIASSMTHSSFMKDFINNKNILNSKKALEATNERLEEYEKQRTDFFANISHELRTPLNVIYSAQQMLDTTVNKSEKIKDRSNKYVKVIRQNCYRLIRLINNLIDITKIDASSFEVKLVNSDIIKVVEDITMSVVDYMENKGINLIFDTDIEEKIIACDANLIERIILNLLSNAIKFTERGGNVYVNIYSKQDNICVSVKDTGIGISEEMSKLVFDRFIQADKSTRRKREGSGIGLALVKSLVEMQGGKIFLSSKLGEGSEFTIMLPDTLLEEVVDLTEFTALGEKQIDMINIEFSDIYE